MRIRSRLLTKLIARVACTLCRLLFATVRIEIRLSTPKTNAFEPVDERFLYCIWHESLLGPVFCGKHPCMAGLVSQHQDGGYLADTMQMLGILPVRGSTNRGGAQAMRQMLDTVRDHHIMITPDGPRGPRHEVKDGIVFLASKSGRAIIPTAFAYKRRWSVQGSWTTLDIPKPFTRAWFLAGEPLRIPAKISREEMERYRVEVERRLKAITEEAARVAAGESPPPQYSIVRRAA